MLYHLKMLFHRLYSKDPPVLLRQVTDCNPDLLQLPLYSLPFPPVYIWSTTPTRVGVGVGTLTYCGCDMHSVAAFLTGHHTHSAKFPTIVCCVNWFYQHRMAPRLCSCTCSATNSESHLFG